MPQLSKVRIVNFYYNDGNRLIADELYNFGDNEGKNAGNVLINLDNGGGKSVLVQLMMQPVLPKATASGRKIESFFTRPNYHSYIVLEWLKDKSNEKLLTGISMRTAANSEDNDDVRGRKIQYYTFMAEYLEESAAESIVNLELSTRQNGNFVAAEYDYIKKLAKNNRRLKCYGQDKSREWKEKLQEFYIYPNEWEMIEKINSVEGGLDNYFSEYRTSDNLIDKLLIPAVEREIRGEYGEKTSEDRSLATMFLNYADMHQKNNALLKKEEVYKKYVSLLSPFVPVTENLYNAEDKFRTSTRMLYGLADALTERKTVQETKKLQLNEQYQSFQKKLYDISHEEISSKYYAEKRIYENTGKSKADTEKQVERLKQKSDELTQKIKIQECADYYERLKKAENDAETITIQIADIENHSDKSAELNRLKYTVHFLAERDIKELSEKLTETENSLKNSRQQEHRLTSESNELTVNINKFTSDISLKNGRLQQLQQQTDSLIKKTDCGIIRNITGSYETEEIKSFITCLKSESIHLETEKQNLTEKINGYKNEKETIPQKNAEITIKKNQNKIRLENIINEIQKYHEAFDCLCQICDVYRLEHSVIFGEQLYDFLKSLLDEKDAEYSNVQNQIQNKEQLLHAAANSCVHIIQAVIDYLNTEKIEYKTCESYLLSQTSKDVSAREKILALLEKYPFLAYSVIIENHEYERLLNDGERIWLSSAVPVFTMEKINEFLDGTASAPAFITGYSAELFENQQEFIADIEKEIHKLKLQLEMKKSEIQQVENYIDKVKAFCYTKEWYSEHHQQQTKLEEILDSFDKEAGEYQKKERILSEMIQNAEYEREKISSELNAISYKLSAAEEIVVSVQNEEELLTEIVKLDKQLKEMKLQKEVNVRDLKEVMVSVAESEEKLKIYTEDIKYAQNAAAETVSCQKTELKEGELKILFEQYQKLSAEQSNDIKILNERLKSVKERMADYQREINSRKLDDVLYKDTVYCESQKQKYENELSDTERILEIADKKKESAIAEYAKAETRYQAVCEELKKYGEPVPEMQIYPDFEKRRTDTENSMKEIIEKLKVVSEIIAVAEKILGRLKDALDISQRTEAAIYIDLQENPEKQYENLLNERRNYKNELEKLRSSAENMLNSVMQQFENDGYGLSESLNNLSQMLSKANGENYFSLNTMTNQYISSAKKMTAKIEADLSGIKRSRSDLVHQCTLHSQQIYNGLEQLAKSSKVKIYDNKSPKHILKIDIPDEFDFSAAEKLISSELDNAVKEFLNKEFTSDLHKRKEAEKIISSSHLLRISIHKNNLTVKAYKIDRNADNAGYRTWEETKNNNSGAEKFIIYFAVILSIMNYSKSEVAGMQNNSVYSTLILDNPFGSTTAPHILNPMFNLASRFKVQLVCLTHIKQNDVVTCFDLVIKAFVKRLSMSAKEVLVHESESETMEHGFYRVEEQLSLF